MKEPILESLLRKMRLKQVLPFLRRYPNCGLLDIGCGWEAKLLRPVHLKAGWLAKSNRLSGVFQIVCLLTLIGSGFLLYYGPVPLRDLTLLAHYVFGFFFIGFFLSHLFIRRKGSRSHQNMASISLRTR